MNRPKNAPRLVLEPVCREASTTHLITALIGDSQPTRCLLEDSPTIRVIFRDLGFIEYHGRVGNTVAGLFKKKIINIGCRTSGQSARTLNGAH